jgi:hypothetical protein
VTRGTALLVAVVNSLCVVGCYRHAEPPAAPPQGARAGHAPEGFRPGIACGQWAEAVGGEAGGAEGHASFPDLFPAAACFVPVRYDGERARPDPTPPGCAYPASADHRRIEDEQGRYERIARGEVKPGERLPPELACDLAPGVRAAAARQNARALLAVRRDLGAGKNYPYSAIGVFGFGHRDHGASVLRGFEVGEACRPMSKDDLDLFTTNVTRAGRAAMAYAGGVAPVIVTSGGAVHSPIVEAFALAHLAVCRFGVPADRVMVDPCADHTHTNVKHVGSLVVALGGRAAYVVTDDHLQRDYLEEWTFWDLIGGSIDQRSLRDWGYLLGSWRRASVGMRAGFWLTPFRFWAEPRDGLGSFTCVR